MTHVEHLITFYSLLDRLAERLGGPRLLASCHGRMNWPQRGVYFFFEPDELRSGSGTGPRVVRVGTHALKEGSDTSLWKRLSQHAGSTRSGGGNHRGSIFRLLVGNALKHRGQAAEPRHWGVGTDAGKVAAQHGLTRAQVLEEELSLECSVSAHIRAMPFLWLDIGDASGSNSDRGYIERNSIALLSSHRGSIDPPSRNWLGIYCDRERVRRSGLWNNNHVEEAYEPAFLGVFEDYIVRQRT